MNAKWKCSIFIGIAALFFVMVQTAQGCDWWLEKTAPTTDVTLAVGESYPVPTFQISVWAGYGCPEGETCTHLPYCDGYIYDRWAASDVLVGQHTWSTVLTPVTFPFTPGAYVSYDECGEYQICNQADVRISPTGTPDITADVCINVHVPCGGCTLTPGYWKTHSSYGPAPYDAAWALVTPNGENSPFFLSGQNWYRVLWTTPAGGNAYYILAHAYIAARLNVLNGTSSTTAVNSALDWAYNFFNTHTPASVLSKSLRNQALAKALILDQYNNGYTGPGHCSE